MSKETETKIAKTFYESGFIDGYKKGYADAGNVESHILEQKDVSKAWEECDAKKVWDK